MLTAVVDVAVGFELTIDEPTVRGQSHNRAAVRRARRSSTCYEGSQMRFAVRLVIPEWIQAARVALAVEVFDEL